MMKTQRSTREGAKRFPYKLLFFTAFLIPALNGLILGWGMLFCTWMTIDAPAFEAVGKALGVLNRILRLSTLACSFMLLGYHAGKEGVKKIAPPVAVSVLFEAAAQAVCLIPYALMILWGKTDSVAPFGEQFLPGLYTSLCQLLILLVIEALMCLFFAMVCRTEKRGVSTDVRSPFMVTAYIIFGVYTLIDLLFSLRLIVSGGFWDYALPSVYAIAYFCVMALTALLFRKTLARYSGEEKKR